MNSHFQSSDTTSISIGLTLESIGRYGSSSCVVFQVRMPSTRMIAHGMLQTTASMRCEYDQLGVYVAEVLDARYFQANHSVRMITGTTTISISSVAVMISDFSSAAIWPLGSRIELWQPLSSAAMAKVSTPGRRELVRACFISLSAGHPRRIDLGFPRLTSG